MLPVFAGRSPRRTPTDCVLIPVRKSRKKMSSRAGVKECRLGCLGAGVMEMASPFPLTNPGTAARSSLKRLAFCQKVEGIVVLGIKRAIFNNVGETVYGTLVVPQDRRFHFSVFATETAGRSSRERFGVCQRFERIGGVGGAAASSRGTECGCPRTTCKAQTTFSSRGCSLIF